MIAFSTEAKTKFYQDISLIKTHFEVGKKIVWDKKILDPPKI